MTDTMVFVTKTVLIKNTNTDLYDYFDEFVHLYQFLFRKVYHNYKHNLNNQKESEYRSWLMKQFLACNKHSVTFGTKKLLKSDIKKFLNKRDNRISYYGDKNEYRQNQQFQISYNAEFNRFDYKIRLDNAYVKDSKYIYGSFYLKNKQAKQELRDILMLKDRPLSYRIIKHGDKLYLHIMFRYSEPVTVNDSNGVLGIDFNKGFITMSDIDKNGKLLKLYKIPYIHKGTTGVCDNSLNSLVNDVMKISLDTNKLIVIEDLKSLNNRKLISDNKRYNSMINLLKFGKFKQKLINKTCKTGSNIDFINPAYTSKIALNKYCYTMKLNVHSGASYVIARRYYGLD